MCYTKPGPRCSSHAREVYQRALLSGNQEVILEARDLYDETPGGQEALKEEHKNASRSEKKEIAARIKMSAQRREIKLEQLKLRQQVEEVHTFSFSHQPDLDLHEIISFQKDFPEDSSNHEHIV